MELTMWRVVVVHVHEGLGKIVFFTLPSVLRRIFPGTKIP